MSREEKIKNIEDRIQLGLVISIFFPSLLSYFMEQNGDLKKVGPWLILVGVYLLNYVLFQSLKKTDISERLLEFLSQFLLAGILLFVFPIIFMATIEGSNVIPSFLGRINALAFVASLWGLPIFSIISLFIISGILLWKRIK